jgi:hypothetical protein
VSSISIDKRSWPALIDLKNHEVEKRHVIVSLEHG